MIGGVAECAGHVVTWDANGQVEVFAPAALDRPALVRQLAPPVRSLVPFRDRCAIHHGRALSLLSLDGALLSVQLPFDLDAVAVDPGSGELVLLEGRLSHWVANLIQGPDGPTLPPSVLTQLAGTVRTKPAPDGGLTDTALTLPFRTTAAAAVRGGVLLSDAERRQLLLVTHPPGIFHALQLRGEGAADTFWPGGGDRLVTLGPDRRTAERWSGVADDLPWPYPLGTVTLPEDVRPLASVPSGAGTWWVATGAPRSVPGLEGIVVGWPADGTPVAAARWSGPEGAAVVALSDGTLRFAAPPPVPPDPAPLPPERVAEFADAATQVATGVGPAAAHQRVRALLAEAWWLDRRPLAVADAWLSAYPDPALSGQVRSARWWSWGTELGSLAVFGVAVGLWRWRDARTRERERALATLHNPFREDSPNHPDRVPFAADTLVEDVLKTLDLNCVMLEGPQFAGKTALLRHLVWRLEHEGLAGRPVRVVLVDLQGVASTDFWTRIGHAVARVYPSEASAEVLELPTADRAAVEYLLDEVLTEDAPRMVLVLDNLDALGLLQTEAQRFRGLIQVVPSHRMAVLAAGGSIRRGWSGHGDESPWFNIFQVRRLEPLSVAQIRAWLERRLREPFSFASDVPEHLHRITEGRPLQVWHVCSAATEHMLVGLRFVLTTEELDAAGVEVRDLGLRFASGDSGGDWDWGLVDLSASWEQVVGWIAEARERKAALQAEVARRRGEGG